MHGNSMRLGVSTRWVAHNGVCFNALDEQSGKIESGQSHTKTKRNLINGVVKMVGNEALRYQVVLLRFEVATRQETEIVELNVQII